MTTQNGQTLGELAKLIRSKNAGPWTLTIDVMLPDQQTYERVIASQTLEADKVAPLLGVETAQVDVYHYAPAHTVKISFPRAVPNGHPEDTDIFGGQQFAPLVDLIVPNSNGAH